MINLQYDKFIQVYINWQEEFERLIRTIGYLTYGKERWFYQNKGIWYDRKDGDYINMQLLYERIYELLDNIIEGGDE